MEDTSFQHSLFLSDCCLVVVRLIPGGTIQLNFRISFLNNHPRTVLLYITLFMTNYGLIPFSCLLLQRLLSQRLQWRFSCVTIMHDTHKKKRSMYYIYLEQRLIIPYHNENFQLKCLLQVCLISKY